jgi:polar amino acid transport system substrate-binding protein
MPLQSLPARRLNSFAEGARLLANIRSRDRNKEHLKMKRILCLSVAAAGILAGGAAFAAECEKLTITGHPQYPAIAWKDDDKIVGAAPMLVEAIGKKLNVPVESKYMGSWADAQQATKDGKADMIVGVYYNDERAQYLDYVQPAFVFDPVVAFVAKDKSFAYTGQDDLIGKKGATNKGESYGNEFDAFIKDKLSVERTDGIDDAFKDLLDGKVDYVLAGYYPGLAEATRMEIENKVQALDPSLLSPEMFVAFSKKSPCVSLKAKFAEELTVLTTDGSFNKMLQDATTAWDVEPDTQ